MVETSNSRSADDRSTKTFDSMGAYSGNSNSSRRSQHKAGVKRAKLLRTLLVLSLIAAVAVCASLAYTILKATEEEVGIQTYQSIALSATTGARAIALRKYQSSEVMATLIGQILPNETDWPFISIDGYIPISQKVATLTSSTTQSLMALVDPADARAWENHTAQVYKAQGRPETTGYSQFGYGIWRPDPNKENKTYSDGRVHDITGENEWGGKHKIMAVLMMHNLPGSKSQMYNLYSEKSRGEHIDSMFDCIAENSNASISPVCPVITDMLELKVSESSPSSERF